MHGMIQPEPAAPLQQINTLPHIAPVHFTGLSPQRAPQMQRMRLGETSTRWLVRLYLATVVFSLFRIVQSWCAARHLLAGSREIDLSEENKRAFERYGQRLSIALPQVRESDEVTGPLILGAAHPVLLLPEDFGRFSASEVRAALCHELAHVKRRDYLGNLLCQLAALPAAWHPLMTIVQQRIRMSREMVCDAMAAREIDSPLSYARSLLALAHGLVGGMEIAEHAQFPGLFGNRLEERVTRLMDTTTMNVRTRFVRVLSGAVVTMATLSTAAIFHVTPTMASPQTPVSPQVAQTTPVVTETQPAEAAPEPITPEQPRDVTRKREPRTADRAREEKELKEQVEEMRQDALRMKAEFDRPEFKREIQDAQRQTLQAKARIDSERLKRQLDEAVQRASRAPIEINSAEIKRQLDEAMQRASRAHTEVNSAEIKRQLDEAQQRMLGQQATIKQQLEDAARRFAEAARELNESPDEDYQNK
jgi:beta-lactamase regulating signal transducer with metallopeptidase domain